MNVAVVLLGAGKGSRMQSQEPKVLHEIAGAPMYYHAFQAAQDLKPTRTVFVTGPENRKIINSLQAFDVSAEVVVQPQQLGTGHAVSLAMQELGNFAGTVLVLYGDTPLLKPTSLQRLLKSAEDGSSFAFLGFEATNPRRYGRVFLDDAGYVSRIREAKDLEPGESRHNLCNGGILCGQAKALTELIPLIRNDNASGEYYLTDIPEIARMRGIRTFLARCTEAEAMGINTRSELAAAEAEYQCRARELFMARGVSLVDPQSVYFSYDTDINPDVRIEPNVVIGRGVSLQSHVVIHSFSYLEGCSIASGVRIGPFARIRPGTHIDVGARVGNFVEIKATALGAGAKVSHLTYVGDAEVGKDTNIGAGTVFCNYDGTRKNRTVVGDNAFIGSNTLLVAPVEVGDGAITGAGTVVTRNVPADSLGIARSKQINKVGLAPRFRSR